MFNLKSTENSTLNTLNNHAMSDHDLPHNLRDRPPSYAAACAGSNGQYPLAAAIENLPSQEDIVDPDDYSRSIRPLMQTNGRKVLGPPDNWVGPIPSSACELFVRRIPKDIDEQNLISQFFRFGPIYEIRLPMDFNQASRGFCYVKYANEQDASCAMEVLSHYFIASKKKLDILHSYEKCRLFVSNIPKSLSDADVKLKMHSLFPSLERMYTRPAYDENTNANRNNGANGNPGYIIIQFPSHMHALEAKKYMTPGMVRMWGRDLKVIWANEERENYVPSMVKTLFLRNVDLSVNKRDLYEILAKFVPRSEVGKISKVRMSAFVDFETRESAETCYRQMQGMVLNGRTIGAEWAKPSEDESLHNMRNIDFDATLRLKCIANNWQIPIIIFGTHFENEGYQYCAVMLRNTEGLTRAVFCILQPHQLVDIHSRLCEVVCLLIETIGEFPDYNYVFFVDKDDAHVLGMITHNIECVKFIAALNVPKYMVLDLNEIIDLSTAVAMLGAVPETQFLQTYYQCLELNYPNSYLEQPIILGYRLFGAIHPNYRNKAPLKYSLNNTQIVLALCYTATRSNKSNAARIFMPTAAALYGDVYDGLHYVALKLLPVALIQSRYCLEHELSHINFGGDAYYHPVQRARQQNNFIMGASYAVTIKQPNALVWYMPNMVAVCNSNCYRQMNQQRTDQLNQFHHTQTMQMQQQLMQSITNMPSAGHQQNYDMQPQAAQSYFTQNTAFSYFSAPDSIQPPSYSLHNLDNQLPTYTLFGTDGQQQPYGCILTEQMSFLQQSIDSLRGGIQTAYNPALQAPENHDETANQQQDQPPEGAQ